MAKSTSLSSRKKSAYHHGDLANALKRVALEIIAKTGVEGFSLREAAKAVGVSPSAVYRHYSDKEALLVAIARDGLAQLAQAFLKEMETPVKDKGLSAQEKATARFMAQGRAYIKFAQANSSLFMVMFGPYCNAEALQADEEAAPSPYDLLSKSLDELVNIGALSPGLRPGAEIPVWSAVHGLASLLVTGALDYHEADGMIELVMQQILRGLGLSAGSPVR